MKDADLDRLLKSYAENSAPSLPGNFQQNVLREIRIRAQKPHGVAGWISEICLLLFRPGILAASLTIAVTIGLAAPALVTPDPHALVASALDLDVFSASTTHLPSGLLARIQ